MKFRIAFLFFKVFRLFERIAAYAQGKGYGAATIQLEVTTLLHLLGSKPLLAVDIGGNVGNYTAELRKRNLDLEIHIFEPSLTNIEKLRRRFDADNSVRIVPFGVSDKTGLATLYSNESGSGLGSLSLRRLDHFGIFFNKSEQISTVRFEDYWVESLQKKTIDIAKIDIEGFELSALMGFGKAVKATKVFQFEFGGCNIDTRTFFQDFWYFFSEHGFDLYRITPFGAEKIDRYRESDEFFSTTNYIAVNRQ